MTKEVAMKIDEYDKRFKGGFPSIPLCLSRPSDEVIKIIDDCLTQGKNVYELGYLPDPKTTKAIY